MKGIAILGSTGSIGTQTLDIVRSFPESFKVVGLAARQSINLLESQVKEFDPKLFSLDTTSENIRRLESYGSSKTDMISMVLDPDVDIVVTSTVGDVALIPTIEAIKIGKTIALANKESIIIAGPLIMRLANDSGARIFPVDSEPSAIWQCLNGESVDNIYFPTQVSKLIITASGGAFRNWHPSKLDSVTPAQALNHPTWQMGAKITVDSATLMNKAFEVIEAHYLFGIPWDDIDVVIHPQSIIHSMVEFDDGSTKAHLGLPDMKIPIQYALFYPDRIQNHSVGRFDPVLSGELTFEAMNSKRYPCFEMALDFAKRGGTWPAALCGADESAVELFISGEIKFTDIPILIDVALKNYNSYDNPDLNQCLSAADWGKRRVKELVNK